VGERCAKWWALGGPQWTSATTASYRKLTLPAPAGRLGPADRRHTAKKKEQGKKEEADKRREEEAEETKQRSTTHALNNCCDTYATFNMLGV